MGLSTICMSKPPLTAQIMFHFFPPCGKCSRSGNDIFLSKNISGWKDGEVKEINSIVEIAVSTSLEKI